MFISFPPGCKQANHQHLDQNARCTQPNYPIGVLGNLDKQLKERLEHVSVGFWKHDAKML
jgi:hypothetical protein